MTADGLDRVEDAIAAIAAGELVVVVDDTDRENEGDLIMAASLATPERIGFMIRHTSGIICVPMTADRAENLHLDPMVGRNSDSMGTAFTVTIDYRPGLTTGISAKERAATIRAVAEPDVQARDFTRPGHVFPLVARDGGVLVRSGHTEAGVDLARLAGLPPVGALSEIVDDSGEPMRLVALMAFAREHGLRIISIEDLIAYRIRCQKMVRRVAEQVVQVGRSQAVVRSYRTHLDSMEHLALCFGEVAGTPGVLTRIHREQPLVDLLDRQKFDTAIREIEAAGQGVLILIRSSSARVGGTQPGLSEKAEGHQSAVVRQQRWKEFGIGAQILRDLDITSITPMSSEARNYVGLAGFGIEVAGFRHL